MAVSRSQQRGEPCTAVQIGYRDELRRLRYSSHSQLRHHWQLYDLEIWLSQGGRSFGDLTAHRFDEFLSEQRERGERLVAQRGSAVLLTYLRSQGLIPEEEKAVDLSPLGRLMDEYHIYLRDQRSLHPETIKNYDRAAAYFLKTLRLTDISEVAALSEEIIRRWTIMISSQRTCMSPRELLSCTRSLLRFLHLRGIIAAPLAQAIAPYRSYRGAQLPKYLLPKETERLLDKGCNRDTLAGQRDYAILLLLYRLALRACEVAALTLDDIDWRAGEIRVRGKGPKLDRMPLPADVGEALATYLRHHDFAFGDRHVFHTLRAPFVPVSRKVASRVVALAAKRIGLAHVGAHRLRHSAATAMLQSGASLYEVGEALRHQQSDTTAIYAKVDQKALLLVARPWPGSES